MNPERKSLNENRQRLICIFTDWATTFMAFLCFNIFRCYYLHYYSEFGGFLQYILSPKLVLEEIFVPVALLFVYWLSGYYNRPFERSRLNEFLNTFYSQIFNSILIYLAALTNDQLYMRRENWILILVLFFLLFCFTYLGRLAVTARMFKLVKKINVRPATVIVGLSDEAVALAKKISADSENRPGAEIVGFMPFGNEKNTGCKDVSFPQTPIIKDIEELKALCAQGRVNQVIMVPQGDKAPDKKVLFFLYNLYPYDVALKINPDIFSIITPTIRLDDILGEPFIDLSRPQIGEFSKNVKRTLDVVASLTAMIVLSPVFLVAAIGVKMSGPGSILYSQERVGIHRKPFKILKFRSMISEAEKNGVPQLSSDNDARITPVGKWMRRYRIDELPQFWNVLKGEMSLVGPRPERAFFIDQIVKKAPWYPLVFQVRPGITSWGMVKYGYATNIDQMIERNRFDLIYLTNMSVAVDIKILLHTIKTVGSGKGK